MVLRSRLLIFGIAATPCTGWSQVWAQMQCFPSFTGGMQKHCQNAGLRPKGLPKNGARQTLCKQCNMSPVFWARHRGIGFKGLPAKHHPSGVGFKDSLPFGTSQEPPPKPPNTRPISIPSATCPVKGVLRFSPPSPPAVKDEISSFTSPTP